MNMAPRVLGKEQTSICPNALRAPERQGRRRRAPEKTKRETMEREESASPPADVEGRYTGVRLRKWGRWVSEIRLPNSRERIWLGSYDSPEKAARAFDAASFCLRGRRARLNFPEAPPPWIPPSASPLTHQQIQAAAARHAYSSLPPQTPPLSSSSSSFSSPASIMVDSVDIDAREYWSFVESLQNFGGDFEIQMNDLAFDFFATAPEAEDQSDGVDLGSESFLWSF